MACEKPRSTEHAACRGAAVAEPLDEAERRAEEAQGAKAVLRDSRAEKPQQDGKAKL